MAQRLRDRMTAVYIVLYERGMMSSVTLVNAMEGFYVDIESEETLITPNYGFGGIGGRNNFV